MPDTHAISKIQARYTCCRDLRALEWRATGSAGTYSRFGRDILPKGVRIMRLPCASVSAVGTCGCAGVTFVGGVRCGPATGKLPTGWGMLPEADADTGAVAVRPETGLAPTTTTGIPPVTAPPPMETTRVDRMDVFPACGLLEPSCNGMISLRVPLSKTMRFGAISVMVYPR